MNPDKTDHNILSCSVVPALPMYVGWDQGDLGNWADFIRVDGTASGRFNFQGRFCQRARAIMTHNFESPSVK